MKIKWSANFAYAIGLIATDGCLYKDKIHLSFVSKDKEQIANFLHCLKIKNIKIGNNYSSKGFHSYRVQFGDVIFYQFLCSIGLMGAKSLVMKDLEIPVRYYFDFLRGCFDGDGYSYSYWDKRWKSSFMFYIGFCSGSRYFFRWLRDTTFELSSLKGHITYSKRKGSCYQLKYSKYEAIKLSKLLYPSR